MAKLSKSDLSLIVEYFKKGMSIRKIARFFEVDESTIRYHLKKIKE